jgi:hypothetical protein
LQQSLSDGVNAMRVASAQRLSPRAKTGLDALDMTLCRYLIEQLSVQLVELNELISERVARAARNGPTPQPRKERHRSPIE